MLEGLNSCSNSKKLESNQKIISMLRINKIQISLTSTLIKNQLTNNHSMLNFQITLEVKS